MCLQCHEGKPDIWSLACKQDQARADTINLLGLFRTTNDMPSTAQMPLGWSQEKQLVGKPTENGA